jgi:ribosomal protein S6--L-glutamate ligase
MMAMENINMIVGWKEWVSIPELDIPIIKAKVDTGAATSSLHAFNIEYLQKNDRQYVKFEVHPLQRNKRVNRFCIAPLFASRHVRSSSGEKQVRPVIKTLLRIGNATWEIELNLTNRDSMGMRMLIGREALSGRILVNTHQKFLYGKFSAKQTKEFYRMKL